MTNNYEFVSEIFEIYIEMIEILTPILLEIFDISTEMLEDRHV